MATYKAVAEWSMPNGDTAQNVFYGEVVGGESADLSDLLTDIAERIGTILAPWLAEVITTMVLQLIKIYLFDAATGVSVPLGTGLLADPGVSTGNCLPGGCAVKINLYAAQRARPAGVYLPPFATPNLQFEGGINSAAVASAAAVGGRMTSPATLTLTGLSWTPQYWSKKDLAMVSLQGAAVAVNGVVDYQRRRKLGRGI